MKETYAKVRLTELEKSMLLAKAKNLNMTMSDYIKYCCLINPPADTEKIINENIEKSISNARASVEMEGLHTSPESEDITKRCLNGEISKEEAKKQILLREGIEI